jgi:isochorismate synthase
MRTLGAERKTNNSVREALSREIGSAISAGKSISLWRLPDSKLRQLVIADEAKLVDQNFNIEDSQPGFLVSRFDPSLPKYFLPADKLFTINESSVEQIAGSEDRATSQVPATIPFHTRPARVTDGTSRNDFERLVSLSIDEIAKGVFEKVVPARARLIDLSADTDLIDVFDRLCQTYPQAFITLTSSETYGTWIGASPELLVHVDKSMTFRTAAIAATQPFGGEEDLKKVSWNQKEIEEQALVERYIISCFKKIRLREFDEHGPRTVRAGNLLHLKTDFSVDMQATNFPQLGSVMLQLLHPTSAVCGMPLEPALQFLRAHEQMDRELYSGFLGPVNIQSETQLYVNLRCMQIMTESRATLYAGAGVTIDSTPSSEWEETVMKMNTLHRVVIS